MIISKLQGGLGNQMFQYIAGRVLADKLNTNFLVDTSLFYKNKIHNGYELEKIFYIDSPQASNDQIKSLIGWRSTYFGYKLLKFFNYKYFLGNNFYLENPLIKDINPNMTNINSYLFGDWQSEKYFISHEKLVRKQFNFKTKLSNKNKEIINFIRSKKNSVSIHIRRGDYISPVEPRGLHDVCTSDYYYSALKIIEEKKSKPYFFIFSDDIPWVKKNLNFDSNHHFIDHNKGSESYNDLRLMSICNNQIIANSSFSWWGAWLNKNKRKIIIAPKKWLNSNILIGADLPNSWIKV